MNKADIFLSDQIKIGLPDKDNSFYDERFFRQYSLSDKLVFVFGSNLSGIHGAGAAREALLKYGAKYGKGIGFYGNSYAIPTKDRNIKTLPLNKVKFHIDNFLTFNKEHEDLLFFITAIGTGLAGFKHKDIAPLFKGVKRSWLPLCWKEYL